jgi:phage-related baseplate assembly protein
MTMLDLSLIPAPDVIETLSFEDVFQNILQRFRVAIGDQWNAAIESDPVMKELETIAYEIVTLRARINSAGKANMLPSSSGNDLDNLLALLGAKRLEDELDPAFRERGRQAPYGFSTAGPLAAYKYHAASAHDDIRDVRVDSPAPGDIRITVLSRVGDGVPTQEVLDAVRDRLSPEDMRPTNDTVIVEPAYPMPWQLVAEVHFPTGAAYEPIMVAAQAAAEAYALAQNKINAAVKVSKIIAAAALPGTSDVKVMSPTGDIEPETQGAPYCTQIILTPRVVYDQQLS